MRSDLKIAVIGPGRIGSTFAFHLSSAGHEVTVVARGERLLQLQRTSAITAIGGASARVVVADVLDVTMPFDLVLVTVLAQQVDEVMPALVASAAKTIIFMFNTFENNERLRDAVGAGRFASAFPNMTAFFVDGKLKSVVNGPGMVTTLSSQAWAAVLKEAGMPTEVELDMTSFLRTHAAFVVPLMAAALLTWKRDTELTWREASRLARAMVEGFALVSSLGHTLKPSYIGILAKFPRVLLAAMMWMAARSAAVKNLGEFGPTETRSLIDQMAAAAHGSIPDLLAIRP
jgi:2-dehydropantoate 2-reductase